MLPDSGSGSSVTVTRLAGLVHQSQNLQQPPPQRTSRARALTLVYAWCLLACLFHRLANVNMVAAQPGAFEHIEQGQSVEIA